MSDRIRAMREGGAILANIRDTLAAGVKPGQTFASIESRAQQLIRKHNVVPSFSTVAGYDWATCIMANEALCHGIPGKQVVHAGDVITIDIGLINQGYHLDTTVTFAVGAVPAGTRQFLATGQEALAAALAEVKAGARVFDVSRAMQRVVEAAGYSAVRELTGHGVGERLHMAPNIPCVGVHADKRVFLEEGQTIAVEIMYAMGSSLLELDSDGWTYLTRDRSLSGMFEDTALVTKEGCEVLTKSATSGTI